MVAYGDDGKLSTKINVISMMVIVKMIRDSKDDDDIYCNECYIFIYYEVPYFDNFIILNTSQSFSIQYK
jgi:hypothetical protein